MSRHWNPSVGQTGRSFRPRRRRRRRPPIGWTQMAVAGVLAAVAFFYLPEGELPRLEAPAEASASGSVRVDDPKAVRITDGDTFRYHGDKIRIADIDTPEVRGACASETQLAAKATRRMEALLRQGPFTLRPIAGRDEDRYGRKLRVVTRDGQSLGDQLVAEGLARTWSGRREPWCA